MIYFFSHRIGVNTDLYDKHTSWRPPRTETREQIYVLFLYGGPPPSLGLNPQPSAVTKPINFSYNHWRSYNVLQARGRPLFHQRYQNSHVHCTVRIPDKGDWLDYCNIEFSSSSLIGSASRFKSGSFNFFTCTKNRFAITLTKNTLIERKTLRSF